jgi:hypothetical protein
MAIQTVVRRARLLESDARRILSTVESARARRFTLDTSYQMLGKLSLKQDDLFRQALRCVEAELYRAAHVMAWAAFVDFLHERLAEDGLNRLRQGKPAWNVAQVEDLRNYGDYQVTEAGEDCGLYGKTMKKALQGLLNKRNECAHPEEYYPSLNDTLGYVDELFKRLAMLQRGSIGPATP